MSEIVFLIALCFAVSVCAGAFFVMDAISHNTQRWSAVGWALASFALAGVCAGLGIAVWGQR